MLSILRIFLRLGGNSCSLLHCPGYSDSGYFYVELVRAILPTWTGRPTSPLSALATIVALFCSVSFGFVLFFMQSNRSERLSTYAKLNRDCSSSTLASFPPGKQRQRIAMAMVFELEKLDISDLPQTDYGDEYKAYAEA